MIEYIFPILASILIGTRFLAYKSLSIEKQFNYPVFIFTVILSQIFIYKSMFFIDNPTIVHLIVHLSVFITFFGSIYLFGLNNFNPYIFFYGLIFIVIGVFCIQYSYL